MAIGWLTFVSQYEAGFLFGVLSPPNEKSLLCALGDSAVRFLFWRRMIFIEPSFPQLLPAFAECPVRKDGNECEKGTLRSSEGAEGMLRRVSPTL